MLLCLALASGGAAAEPASVYVSGVPNVPEDDYIPNCGPAAVTAVVQSYDPAISYARVLRAVLNRSAGGTYISAINRFARSLGMSVVEDRFTTVHDPELHRLHDYLAAGTPVLVEQSATLEDRTLHMRVAVGLDEIRRDVVFVDPLFGPGYRVSFADFARLQENGPNIYLVLAPRGRTFAGRASATPPDYGAPLPLQRRWLIAEAAFGLAQQGENRRAALLLARRASEFSGRERAIMFEQAAHYARLGGYTSLALRALDETEKVFGTFQWLAVERARDQVAQGSVAAALATLRRYAETLDGEDLLLYGDLLAQGGDRAGALAAYRRAADADAGLWSVEARRRMALL